MKLFRRNGIYWVRHGESKRSLGTRDTEEAKRLYGLIKAAWEDEARQRKIIALDGSRATLGRFLAEYKEYRRPPTVKAETFRRDMRVLASLAEVVGDSQILSRLTAKQLALWQRRLLDNGASPRTVNSYRRHLLAALSTAHDWGYLVKTPKIRRLTEPEPEDRGLTLEQFNKILAKVSDPEYRHMFTFYAFTGLRRQEALDLTWTDVHMQEMGEPPHVHVRKGKRDKARVVPLIPEAVDALGEPKDVGPVFRQVTGGRVSHVFKLAAVDAGLGWFRLHDLRHTAGHFLAEAGVEGRLIQDILGHSNITTTRRYTFRASTKQMYRSLMMISGHGTNQEQS